MKQWMICLAFISLSVEASVTVVDPGQGPGSGAFGRYNQMKLSAAGFPVTVFSDSNSLYVLSCNDPVCAGGDDSAIKILSNLSTTSAYYGFVLDDMGYPVISYYDEGNTDLMLVHCLDVKCALPAQMNTISHVNDVGQRSALALDAAGNPVIAFNNTTNDDLLLVHCDDAFCAGGNDSPNLVYDGSIGIGDISLALDASGFPVIAFEGDFTPRLVHCNDVNCAGSNESLNTLISHTAGTQVDMVLDTNGYPVVIVDVSGDTTLIRCNDANCDNAVNGVESTETLINTGLWAGLALDDAGRPIIATSDSSAMHVIRCNDVNCADSDEIYSSLPGYVGFEVSLAIDAMGFPVTVGFASPGLRFAHCNDGFCTGNNEDAGYVNSVKLDVGSHADMLISGGEFLWSYYDKTSGNLRIRRCETAACDDFSDLTAVIENAPSINFGEYNSLALTADDKPVVSFYDGFNQSLHIISCHNSSCSTYDSVAVDAPGDVGKYGTLLLDALGQPVISYYDFTNDKFKVAHCDTPNCISFDNNINTVDFGGEYNDMKLDDSGFPVISFHDSFFTSVNLVHCNDANCDETVNGPESIQSLDATGDVGLYTSLVLDDSSFPLFSYFDATNGALKVIHCNDANCDPAVNGAESISTVDDGNGNDVGYFTSLAMDVDGLPVISYYDMSAMNLMLLKCVDLSCANHTTNKMIAVENVLISGYTKLSINNGKAYITYYNAADKQLEMVELVVPDIIFKNGFG
jgi:hypothetical protein